MKEQSYKSLRDEWISIFNSFRNLVSAQIAAVVIILYNLLNSNSSETVIFLSIALAIIIVLVTKIGTSWYVQAVRQVAYIFVAYELEALSKDGYDKIDRNWLWVLANRSQGFEAKKKENTKSYFTGFELNVFYWQQIAFAMLSTTIIVHQFYKLAIVNFGGEMTFETAILFIAVILNLYTIHICYQLKKDAKHITRDETQKWIEYLQNRKKYDDLYLSEMNFDKYINQLRRNRLNKGSS